MPLGYDEARALPAAERKDVLSARLLPLCARLWLSRSYRQRKDVLSARLLPHVAELQKPAIVLKAQRCLECEVIATESAL